VVTAVVAVVAVACVRTCLLWWSTRKGGEPIVNIVCNSNCRVHAIVLTRVRMVVEKAAMVVLVIAVHEYLYGVVDAESSREVVVVSRVVSICVVEHAVLVVVVVL